jgi:UDP-glucose 4-epimerase
LGAGSTLKFMVPKFKKILVTGGSGFVGRHMVKNFVSTGHHVIATTTRIVPGIGQDPQLEWVEWNALESKLPDINWESIDAILHLAVPRPPFAYPSDEDALFKVVVESTFQLLEQARVAGIKRFVLASTGDVLGGQCPALESNSNFEPDSFYGTAKANAELLVRSYNKSLSCSITRFYHPYGPGADKFLINRLISKVIEGITITIEGVDGISVNPIYIDDLTTGLQLVLLSDETGVFNLAGPETVTLRSLLEIVGEVVGQTPLINANGEACIERHVGDMTRLTSRLEYFPKTFLYEGTRCLLDLTSMAETV